MKLLVDMGNSALKWATVSSGVLSQVQSSGYEELADQLKSQWQALDRPGAIIVSCVTHEQQWQELCQLTRSIWDMLPERIATADKGFDVINAYYRPENLGSDRWAAMIAAHAKYQDDVCIIGCGTALTIDVLQADGQHLGGVIIPGADMMQSSLHENTAAISQSVPHGSKEESEYWGRDTQSGIIKGSWLALAGAVNQVYSQFEAKSGKPVCVLFGGGARQLNHYLAMDTEFVPELVLQGLAIIAGEKLKI